MHFYFSSIESHLKNKHKFDQKRKKEPVPRPSRATAGILWFLSSQLSAAPAAVPAHLGPHLSQCHVCKHRLTSPSLSTPQKREMIMKICLVFLKRFNQSLHHIYFCSWFSKNLFIYFWDRISYCSSIGLELAGSTRLALNSHTSAIPAYALGVLRLRHVTPHPVYFCLFKISFLNQDLVQLPTLSGNFACSPGWP